ncbi:MAG: hypothetical protein ACPG77_03790, partial [Nannocystaceae bacterium]
MASMHGFVFTWVLLAAVAPGRGYEGPLAPSSTDSQAPATQAPATPAYPPTRTSEAPAAGDDSGNLPPENVPTEDVPTEDIPTEDIPTEEIGADDSVYVGETRREIIVTANLLGGGTRMDAFRQAGGRSVLELAGAKDVGYTTVAAALDRTPGVRSVEDGA